MAKQRGTGTAAPRAFEVPVHATKAEIAAGLRYVRRHHTHTYCQRHPEGSWTTARLSPLSAASRRDLTSADSAEAPASPSGP